MSSQKLVTVEQLAQLIHKSPSTIRADISRAPESLPPFVKLPGNVRVFFVNVDEWLDQAIEHGLEQSRRRIEARAAGSVARREPPPPPRRRGRPTKAEQLARRAQS